MRIITQAAISGQAVTGSRTAVPRRLRTQNNSLRRVLGFSIQVFKPGRRHFIRVSIDFTA